MSNLSRLALVERVQGPRLSKSRRRTPSLVRRVSSRGPIEECLDSLKRNDPEAVLQLPFWPKHSQPGFVAIKAFHAEIDAIPAAVSRSGKTLIAQMRYHWWRQAINSCYLSDQHQSIPQDTHQVPSNHPLIQALKPLIKQHKLSKYYFTRIINGSESHYLDPRFTDLAGLVDHSRSTTYAGLSLLAQLLTSSGEKGKIGVPLETIDHSLAHLATFLTIVRLLSRLPYYVGHRQTNIIPLELMECPDESLFRLFTSRRSSQNNSLELEQDAARSIINLVFLAWSELVAAREVITLDPSHLHSSSTDFRSHKNATRIDNHIFSGRSHLPKVTIDTSLVPLFLAATPARSHLSKISKIILNDSNKNREGRNMTSDLIDRVARKPDWTIPFKLWFDFCFSKL